MRILKMIADRIAIEYMRINAITICLCFELLFLSGCQHNVLPTCTGVNTNDFDIVKKVIDQGYLFGDTCEAWQIRMRRQLDITTNDIPTDKSDTKYAVDTAEDMLCLSNNSNSNPVVYKRGNDSVTVFVVTYPGTNEVYLLIMWH